MGKTVLWMIVIGVVLLVGVGAYGWWWFDGRWRPKTIDRDQAQIAAVLDHAGWVSPQVGGPKLYVIGYRSCPDCLRYWGSELPKLQEAGVDTRVILVARADDNGQAKSTPAERSTVAELWVNRDWRVFQKWLTVAPEFWPAAGIIPADGDTARGAVVEASRKLVTDLRPLLSRNGLEVSDNGLRYPTLVWWTKDGKMRACVCERPETWRYVRKDLLGRK